jgi:RNA polymerase sigma-70 factor (ECF subfamily)
MKLTDIQLMYLVKTGDDDAFGDLLQRHQKKLINFFFKLCWNAALAEDMAQDAFLKIYASRENYEARSKFTTYLYRVSRNLWIDHVRKVTRRPSSVSIDQSNDEDMKFSDAIATEDRGDERFQEVEEKMSKVMKAVDKLPLGQRELFAMVNVEGLKYKEIGAILDIPVGTVKTRMHSLMKKLRTELVGT